MEICIECLDGEKYTVEVGVDDTITDIRRKAAAAAALCEDGFDMHFGGKVMAEGDFTTQLSAGDTVVLTKKTKSQKEHAIAALRDLGWETRLTAESLVGLTDPKLVHLFLQAEVVTEIPNAFLSGGTFRELDLSGVSAVTKVGSDFLSNCTSLATIDISGWNNVTHIGNGFLQNCGRYIWTPGFSGVRLDISGWNNVTYLGKLFLENSKVRTLDISGWNKVTEIKHSFLHSCCMLTSLDLSGWGNVTRIGRRFLLDCTRLTTLDLSGWNKVTEIGSNFLSNCSSLTTLDISGWNKVTEIGSNFLYNCSSLTTLDISGWNSVTHVEEYFLANCTSLSTLNLSGWSSVTQIETPFLKRCRIHASSINVTGSSCIVLYNVSHNRYITFTKDEAKETCHCVCM